MATQIKKGTEASFVLGNEEYPQNTVIIRTIGPKIIFLPVFRNSMPFVTREFDWNQLSNGDTGEPFNTMDEALTFISGVVYSADAIFPVPPTEYEYLSIKI